jgi:CRP/FNR family transcriptional regulator
MVAKRWIVFGYALINVMAATPLLDRVAVLRQTALFRSFSEGELAEIAQQAILRKLRRDEALVFEGEEAKGVFVLAEGSVRVFREGSDGREQVIRIEHAVCTLNELHLFDGGPQPASISACHEALVLWLQAPQYKAKCNHSPEAAWDALEMLARRLRETFDLIQSLGLMHADQRLARYLLEEASLHGTRGPEGLLFRLTMSNQQIGAVVGAVREVVSRSLAKLQANGLIVMRGRVVTIIDESRLLRFIAAPAAAKSRSAAAS